MKRKAAALAVCALSFVFLIGCSRALEGIGCYELFTSLRGVCELYPGTSYHPIQIDDRCFLVTCEKDDSAVALAPVIEADCSRGDVDFQDYDVALYAMVEIEDAVQEKCDAKEDSD